MAFDLCHNMRTSASNGEGDERGRRERAERIAAQPDGSKTTHRRAAPDTVVKGAAAKGAVLALRLQSARDASIHEIQLCCCCSFRRQALIG